MEKPVMTMELADKIVRESNKMLQQLGIDAVPRPVILSIAIITMARYTGQPVLIDTEQ